MHTEYRGSQSESQKIYATRLRSEANMEFSDLPGTNRKYARSLIGFETRLKNDYLARVEAWRDVGESIFIEPRMSTMAFRGSLLHKMVSSSFFVLLGFVRVLFIASKDVDWLLGNILSTNQGIATNLGRNREQCIGQ
jgi:hypothetical protein